MPSTDRHRNTGTLLGVAHGTPDATTDAAVVGVPFDMGAHPDRVGSRSAPTHIRHHSSSVRERAQTYGVPPLETLSIVDCGDLDLTPGQVDHALDAIERAVSAVLDTATLPLMLGGDGTVALPQLRAVAKQHSDLVMVHYDAHTDAYDLDEPHPVNNANAFVHAAREGLIDPGRSFHVGVRETRFEGHLGWLSTAADLGYQLITVDEIAERGLRDTTARIADALRGRPVYVCWDMDVFDPSVAPGVTTPSWGGLSAREGLALIRGLAGLDLVAFDINAVSPPHDVNGQTGSLAAQVALEFLLLLTAGIGASTAVQS
jgi:agmatinase